NCRSGARAPQTRGTSGRGCGGEGAANGAAIQAGSSLVASGKEVPGPLSIGRVGVFVANLRAILGGVVGFPLIRQAHCQLVFVGSVFFRSDVDRGRGRAIRWL